MEKEAKIIPFKTKEQVRNERNFRHLSDHLFANPCAHCIDVNTSYCEQECRVTMERKFRENILNNSKSF
jgi:hypothetical protein